MASLTSECSYSLRCPNTWLGSPSPIKATECLDVLVDVVEVLHFEHAFDHGDDQEVALRIEWPDICFSIIFRHRQTPVTACGRRAIATEPGRLI
jgi:hypothetical protein